MDKIKSCIFFARYTVYSVYMLKAYDESPIRKFNRFWSCLFSNSTTIHDSLNVCSGTSRCMPNSGTIVLTANYEYSWKVHVSSRRRARCKRGTPLWKLQYIRIFQHEYAYKLILRVKSRREIRFLQIITDVLSFLWLTIQLDSLYYYHKNWHVIKFL